MWCFTNSATISTCRYWSGLDANASAWCSSTVVAIVMLAWYSCRLRCHICGVCAGGVPRPTGVSKAYEEEKARRKGHSQQVWLGV